MKKISRLCILILFTPSICLSQIEYSDDYYLSNLNSYSLINSDFNILTFNKNYWFDNQIQFRYNAKIYYGNYFKSVIGIRNRFIRGFQWEKNLFNFRNQNINLPNTISSSKEKFAILNQIDRIYFEFDKNNLNISLGKQRINWGIQNFWNSHDLFNQLNIFDFDYIERPGNDAIRIQYYLNNFNSFEYVINEEIKAFLLKLNYFKYDYQFLYAENTDEDIFGLGWSGQIFKLGFKGEFSLFKTKLSTENNLLVGSIFLDYIFKNNLYLNFGCLYNSGYSELNSFNLFNLNVSAKSPMPFKYNFSYQINKSVSDLTQIGFFIIHDHKLNFIFISPQLTYSISNKIDLMIISQNIWLKVFNKSENITKSVFTRIQYNF